MSSECGDEFPIARIPKLDCVVEARGSNDGTVRGEGDVVDLFLVAVQAGDRLGGGQWVPEVDCEVVACGDETFSDAVIYNCGFFVSFFRFCGLGFVGGGDVASVVVVGGAEDEVGGEGEVVDPVGVGGECGD